MKKSGLSLILLSLVLVSSLMFVSASVLEEPLPEDGFLIKVARALNLGVNYNTFFISIIMIAIIILALYEILTLTSLFQDGKVKIIISIGLGFIFVLTGGVNAITKFMVGLLSWAGAFAIWLEIGVSIVIFIGLSIGAGPIQNWANKQYARREKYIASRRSAKVNAGAKFLTDVQENK